MLDASSSTILVTATRTIRMVCLVLRYLTTADLTAARNHNTRLGTRRDARPNVRD